MPTLKHIHPAYRIFLLHSFFPILAGEGWISGSDFEFGKEKIRFFNPQSDSEFAIVQSRSTVGLLGLAFLILVFFSSVLRSPALPPPEIRREFVVESQESPQTGIYIFQNPSREGGN